MEVFIIIAAWLLGSIVAYQFIQKWENHSKVSKLYYLAIWPVTLILYLLHVISNK